jgi:D-arginine dehydrogenase
MLDVDILIVGSGMAGASAAFHLAPHKRVLVVEREGQHGYHTTGRSAALYIESYGNEAIRRLTAASRPFFDAPPAGFAEHPLLRPRPCVYMAGPAQLAALEALHAELAATGVEVRGLTAAQVLERVPILYREAVAAGLEEPGACDIDVDALHSGFLRGARALGAEIRAGAGVVGLARESGGWRATLAGGEVVRAAVVIDAAGAWADQMATLAGVAPVGLQPMRRTAMLLDAPPGRDLSGWPALIDVDEQFYFKPEAGKLLASPADETPSDPCDAWADDLDVALCIDRIQQVADLPVTRAPKTWAGLRTFAPDRTLVIGFDPSAEGFFWLAGQGGYGVQTAPAAGRLAAALALGREVPLDPAERGLTEAVVSPVRFRR